MGLKLKTTVKIIGIIEAISASLGIAFAVLMLINSYPLMNDPNHRTGASFGVAYGGLSLILFLPLLIAGITTFRLKVLGRIIHIIGCYLIIAMTIGVVAVNIYSILRHGGIGYIKEEAGYLLSLIPAVALFIIIPATIIYIFTRPKVKEWFK